jgi:hypothetical protein
LAGTIELPPLREQTKAYLQRNAISIELCDDDLERAVRGSLVIKVIYLPKQAHQDLALVDSDSVVTTRLDPGVDPVAVAERLGHVLAILRLGNRIPKIPETLPSDDSASKSGASQDSKPSPTMEEGAVLDVLDDGRVTISFAKHTRLAPGDPMCIFRRQRDGSLVSVARVAVSEIGDEKTVCRVLEEEGTRLPISVGDRVLPEAEFRRFNEDFPGFNTTGSLSPDQPTADALNAFVHVLAIGNAGLERALKQVILAESIVEPANTEHPAPRWLALGGAGIGVHFPAGLFEVV